MYVYVRVMYVKCGRSHMTTWGIYTHVMVAFGMALYGRVEGLTCAAWMVPAMHMARGELVNLLYQIKCIKRNIALYTTSTPCHRYVISPQGQPNESQSHDQTTHFFDCPAQVR